MRRVLHLVGDSGSEKDVNVSKLYASSCQSYEEFDFMFAVITPDRLWSFKRRVLQEGYTEVDPNLPQKVPLYAAIKFIVSELKPDVAVNHMFCHNGLVHIRALMELLDIPVVGSSSNVQRTTMDKAVTRAILVQGGVQMAKGIVLHQYQLKSTDCSLVLKDLVTEIGLPCVVKSPCVEDSKGVFHVNEESELLPSIKSAFELDSTVVVEKFISGREVRSIILEDENGKLQQLPIMEYVVDPDRIRDYTFKLEWDSEGKTQKSRKQSWSFLKSSNPSYGGVLNEVIINNVQKASRAAFQLLHLKDFGIFDFRVSAGGEAYLLEVNLFWSLGSQSIVNVCANEAGYKQKDLLKLVLNRTIEKINKNKLP